MNSSEKFREKIIMKGNYLIEQQIPPSIPKSLQAFKDELDRLCSLPEDKYYIRCIRGFWIINQLISIILEQIILNEDRNLFFVELHPTEIEFEKEPAPINRKLQKAFRNFIAFKSEEDFCSKVKAASVTTHKMMRNYDGDTYTSNLFSNINRKIILEKITESNNEKPTDSLSSNNTSEFKIQEFIDSSASNNLLEPNSEKPIDSSSELNSSNDPKSEKTYCFNYKIVNKYNNIIKIGDWIKMQLSNRILMLKVTSLDKDKKTITLQSNILVNSNIDLDTLLSNTKEPVEAICYKKIEPCKYYMDILSVYIYNIFFLGIGNNNSSEIPQKMYDLIYSQIHFIRQQQKNENEVVIEIKRNHNKSEPSAILPYIQESLIDIYLKLSYPDAKNSFYNQENKDIKRIKLLSNDVVNLINTFSQISKVTQVDIFQNYISDKDLEQYNHIFPNSGQDKFSSFDKLAFDYLFIDSQSLTNYQNHKVEIEKFSNEIKIQKEEIGTLNSKIVDWQKLEQRIKGIGLCLGALLLGVSFFLGGQIQNRKNQKTIEDICNQANEKVKKETIVKKLCNL